MIQSGGYNNTNFFIGYSLPCYTTVLIFKNRSSYEKLTFPNKFKLN